MKSSIPCAALAAILGPLAVSPVHGECPPTKLMLIPPVIYVVTPIDGAPDVVGAEGPPQFGTANAIVFRDRFGNPVPDLHVRIEFPCDISLCTHSPGPPYSTTFQQTVTCDATGHTLHVVTDANGRVEFVAMGAARDPGGGGRLEDGGLIPSAVIALDDCDTLKVVIAAVLDQDGATGSGAGVSALDASIVLSTFISIHAFGSDPVGRADLDGSGNITALDAATELRHYLRLKSWNTATGCGTSYCGPVPCP